MKLDKHLLKREAVGLAAAILMSTLSACGQTDGAAGQMAETKTEATAETEKETGGEVQNSEENADNPTVTILAIPRAECAPMAEWGMFKDAEAAAGVNAEFIEVSTGWDEKKAVTLASNDLPDIFLGSVGGDDIASNLELFVDMTDLIEQYAPNIKRMYEEVPAAKIAGTYEGGIYSLPLIRGFYPHSYTTLSINQEWLDRLQLEVPTTIDEFEQCLIAFRDNDANGNGDPNDEIPLDFPNSTIHDIYCLTGAYGAAEVGGDWVTIKDGKITFLYETEAFRKVTELVHKWYEEGLITPEVYTNDYSASNALCSQGDVARVGALTGYSPDSRAGKFGSEYTTLPQLIAGDEYERIWPATCDGIDIVPDRVSITRQCEDPVAAIKLIDQFYTDDFTIQSYYGSFDTGIVTKYDDGTYSIQCPEGYDSIDSAKWELSLVDLGPGNFSPRLEEKVKAPEELLKRVEIDKVNWPYMPDAQNMWPEVAKFSAEDTEEISYLKADIWSLVNQNKAKWIVEGGIDDEWDSYLEELDNLGNERLKEIYQKTYDEYWASME